MPTPKFSEEELELLSPEEREGMLEDIDNGDDEENDELNAGGDAGTVAAGADTSGLGVDPLKPAPVVAAAAGDAGADGKPAPVVVPDPAAAAAAAAAAAPVVVEGTDPSVPYAEPVGPSAFTPKYEPPEVNEKKVSELQAQIDAADKLFDDAEISAAELTAQKRPLEKEVRRLERIIDNSKDVVTNWSENIVPAYFDANPQFRASAAMWAELDNQVRLIQAESLNPFDPSILPRAHKAAVASMRAAMGLPPEDPAKPAPKPPAGARRDLPPSLANVPASDISDTVDNSEFAYLDRLQERNDTSFEDALAKLTEEQHARYLAAG
ncbi:hypothetical protein LJR231_001576 [Phyllobacterium sp. LjRoot231]|uniref:hypothetical protein n=1 Tax=Phyllobacterium sp. LjRoot231 TaxID=3342289 RepID=UPI003ECC8115